MRTFETGAIRDVGTGKGRCDLMPLDVLSAILESNSLMHIHRFTSDGDAEHLHDIIEVFVNKNNLCGKREQPKAQIAGAMLEVAKVFQQGAEHYGENNWKKGIKTDVYIDSAVRHYLKFRAKHDDEPHEYHFLWNILCCIWTCENMPELNVYKNGDK